MLFKQKSTNFFPASLPSNNPASIAVLLLFFVGFADGSILPFFALWAQKEAGIAVPFIGLLLACYAGGELLATPFIGGIADRIGRRPVIIMSTAGVGLGFVALAFSRGLVTPILLLLWIGICESVVHPSIFTVIADSTLADQHRSMFARGRVTLNAGRVVGPLCGALLARLFLGAVFLGSGAALLVAAFLAVVCLNETRQPSGDRDEEEEESLANLLPAFRDGRLGMLLLWFLVLEITGGWAESVLPLYAHDAGTLTASGVGLLFSYAALLVVCFQLLLTRALQPTSSFRMILASGIVLVGGFACLCVSARPSALVVAVTLFSLADMLVGPVIPTIVTALAPPRARATYQAASSVTSDLRDSLGPATGTALYAFGTRLPWLIGIPLTAVAAWTLAHQISRHERNLQCKTDDNDVHPETQMERFSSD